MLINDTRLINLPFRQQQPQNSPATRQKYEEAKQELQALLSRKKQVDNNLVSFRLYLSRFVISPRQTDILFQGESRTLYISF